LGTALNDLNVLDRGLTREFESSLYFALGGVLARIKEDLNPTQYRVTIYAEKLTRAMYPD
jgi:hypothetical protein